MYTNIGHMNLAENTYSDLKSRVYGRISASPPRQVWTVGDFEDFGTREAIYKILQRLSRTGQLRRLAFGLYDRPRRGRLTGKPVPVDYRAVIDALARRDQTRMLIDGMTAANDLGLTDAVPGRILVHSDARLKPIHLGNQIITFRRTSASKLYWADQPAMRIVQALHWLKPKLSDPTESRRIRRRIQILLSDAQQGATLRKSLRNGLQTLPAWMQDFLGDLLNMPPPSSSISVGRKNARKRSKSGTT
jgi:hypothetical protein